MDPAVISAVSCVEDSTDGLCLLHLTKAFGRNTAAQDVSFGIPHGDVFAPLGPNGAGKLRTISLIRGDIRPSHNGGDVLIECLSITAHRAAARSHLGVCPQFGAMDSMTVSARAQGVPRIAANISATLSAVGLDAFKNRMANALSGNNKHKLSLAIALMGNPSVLLLDEPSSGMDAVAKCVMWKTLLGVVAQGVRCSLRTTRRKMRIHWLRVLES